MSGLSDRLRLVSTASPVENGFMSDLSEIAARNNGAWCATVWRSHGLPVEHGPGLVFCTAPTPRFYPNLVTLDRDADPVVQRAIVVDQCAGHPGQALSVKDSFARLDLAGLGFELLFEARWVFRAATPDTAEPGPLSWRRIETLVELMAWEAAWDPAGLPGVFRAALLSEPSVAVLAGFDAEGRIRAGGVANRDAGVLGLSNIFGSRLGVLRAATGLWPALDMVGYESGNDLKAMEYHGFAALGPLRVWTKPAR